MKTLYKQCNLSNRDSHMTAWLDAAIVKPGIKVTLKDAEDPALWWTIDSVGETAMAKEDIKGAHGSKKWYGNDFHGTLKGLQIKNG